MWSALTSFANFKGLKLQPLCGGKIWLRRAADLLLYCTISFLSRSHTRFDWRQSPTDNEKCQLKVVIHTKKVKSNLCAYVHWGANRFCTASCGEKWSKLEALFDISELIHSKKTRLSQSSIFSRFIFTHECSYIIHNLQL